MSEKYWGLKKAKPGEVMSLFRRMVTSMRIMPDGLLFDYKTTERAMEIVTDLHDAKHTGFIHDSTVEAVTTFERLASAADELRNEDEQDVP